MGLPILHLNLESLAEVDHVMFALLKATLRQERLIATRDEELAGVTKRHASAIDKAALEITVREARIECYYVTHRKELETSEKKSVQLVNGLMGMRKPSNPALLPLSDTWTWPKITAKVRRLWKAKYFHKAKAPGLDKVKLKKELDEAQLKKCGLSCDDSETFFYELNRVPMPDQVDQEYGEPA